MIFCEVSVLPESLNNASGSHINMSNNLGGAEQWNVKEAEVLSAPPKLVYNKFVLRFARDLLGAVVNQWNEHVLVIDKIIPQNWKDEPTARILELSILHLAMAEITEIGTKHQIVINEAIDLTKRFCDGSAPRIINGCLRTFIKDYNSRIAAA